MKKNQFPTSSHSLETTNPVQEYFRRAEDFLELPEEVTIPLNHIIWLAVENRLSNRFVDLEKNQIVLQKYAHSWIIIFRGSYFAVPKHLIEGYNKKNTANPYLHYLKWEKPIYKIRHKNETVLVYSSNISLVDVVTKGFGERVESTLISENKE